MSTASPANQFFSQRTAITLVIANMVGTGAVSYTHLTLPTKA